MSDHRLAANAGRKRGPHITSNGALRVAIVAANILLWSLIIHGCTEIFHG